MYILVNKVPVDVFKIKDISGIIDLNMKKFRTAVSYLEYPNFENFRNRCIRSEEKRSINAVINIINYMINDIRKGNVDTMTGDIPTDYTVEEKMLLCPQDKVYGYYFCIELEKDKDYICSKIYRTKAEAEKVLKDFLELINTVRCIVSEINI